MKPWPPAILCILSISLNAAERPIINEPAFSKQAWQNRSTAVLPVIIAPGIALPDNGTNLQICAILSDEKQPFRFDDYRFHGESHKVNDRTILLDFDIIRTTLLEKQEYDRTASISSGNRRYEGEWSDRTSQDRQMETDNS